MSLINNALVYVDCYFAKSEFFNDEWFAQLERECASRSKYSKACRELRAAGLLPADFIPVYSPGERGL